VGWSGLSRGKLDLHLLFRLYECLLNGVWGVADGTERAWKETTSIERIELCIMIRIQFGHCLQVSPIRSKSL
jgi:hypothetical protein